MPSYWLLKTEPGEYSYADLERDRRAEWDGVTNPTAQKNMRAMKVDDLCVVYHTGDEKAVVGVAEVTAGPTPDPSDPAGKLVVVTVKPVRALKRPVTLAEIKKRPELAKMALLRIGRLSVTPVTEAEWKVILSMAG